MFCNVSQTPAQILSGLFISENLPTGIRFKNVVQVNLTGSFRRTGNLFGSYTNEEKLEGV